MRTVDRAVSLDEGLRAYMVRVFALMAAGVGVTGAVSFAVASSPTLLNAIFGSGLVWLVIFAPLALVMVLSFGINRMSVGAAQATFFGYAALMGLSLASIFILYTQASIARVFFISAGTFLGMALYGYTTKRDLTGIGSFLIMGVWGLMLAMLVNIFWNPQGMQFALSIIAVLLFTGLTAFDAQRIKSLYLEADTPETAGKKAILGALQLYLDFINIFINLLRIMGNRR
jgi:hypothetical protein